MEMDPFAKLEERISKAITHIDALTQKCRTLEEKNEGLTANLTRLEKEMQEEKAAATQKEAEWNRVSGAIKEKIEVLLNRISGYEKAGGEF